MRTTALLMVLLHASVVFALPGKTPLPEEEWTEEAKLVLAQALVGEADWSSTDHVAIAWVLAKRWRMYRATHPGTSFEAFIRLYSSPMKVDSPRTRAIRALPWGEAVGKWGGKRWLRVQKRVERWGRGVEKDPCPQALHWGGTMDKAPTPRRHMWQISHCSERTKNTFYEPAWHAPEPS